ncbi:MAG TPA: agmatinase [Terriglobales bacterium]|nr:agmatinase [Terriglobales bacterium]
MTNPIPAGHGTPALVGIPFDANSSFMRGTAEAPPIIREAFRSDSTNLCTESGLDLEGNPMFTDAGDMKVSEDHAFRDIEAGISQMLDKGQRPISLGGDHSITYPIVRALYRKFGQLSIIHFDAHPDLYEEFDGNRNSHACPFARILEESMVKQLIQVGIRTMNPHQKKQAEKYEVQVIEMEKLPMYDRLKRAGPVYISFDVDALDPAFAPGVSHREPGGMTVREAMRHLHAITGDIVGADLVEYNPKQDVSNLTAAVCGKILKELLGKMLGC